MNRTLIAALLVVSRLAFAEDAPKPAPKPELPRKLAVGSEGFFNPGLLVQTFAGVDFKGGKDFTSTVRLRRVEFALKGELLPGRFSYSVMFDPSRVLEAVTVATSVSGGGGGSVSTKQPANNLSTLQDVMLTWQTEYADITAGQFKIPISYDAYITSASKLLLPDRSTVAKEWGDKRDVGVRVAKTFKPFAYTFAVFNGAGQNALDGNNAKDLALRLDAFPLAGLTVSGVAYSSVGHRGLAGTKDRWEGDLRYERGPFIGLAEFFHARDVGTGGAVTFSQGFTAMAAYAVDDQLVPAVRLSRLNPNIHRELNLATDKRDQAWMMEVGLNYLVKKHEAKFQLWYGRTQNDHQAGIDQVLLTAQAGF